MYAYPSQEVALASSHGTEWGCGLLLEMQMGAIDGGVSLACLSQFPDEHELVFPPLCALELAGEPRFDVLAKTSGNRDRAQVVVLPLRLSLPPLAPAPTAASASHNTPQTGIDIPPSFAPGVATVPLPATASLSPLPPAASSMLAQEVLLQLQRKLRAAHAARVRAAEGVEQESSVVERGGCVADAIVLSAREVVASAGSEKVCACTLGSSAIGLGLFWRRNRTLLPKE